MTKDETKNDNQLEIPKITPYIPKGINPKNARFLIIVTDGVNWNFTPETNVSVLEFKEICREFLENKKIYKVD